MAQVDSTRCLRRTSTWNHNKSHLPKYSSLPELQPVVNEWPLCRQCGFTNSLITPWCTWACKEAKHESKSSMPRARRASAPPRVFIRIALSPSSGKFTLFADDHENIDSARSAASSKQTGTNAKPSVIDPPSIVPSILSHMAVHQTLVDAVNSHRDHIYDIDTNIANDLTRQHPVPATLEGFADVATATCSFSASPSSLAQTRTVPVERVESNPEENNNSKTETESLTDSSWILPLISERTSSAPLRLESVDCSHSDPISATKPKIALKVSRGAFNIGCADKIPAFHLDDAHEHAKNVSLSHDETTPSPTKSAHSPKHQHFRPLRRKNHLHIMPSNPDSDASEPIAISLTLHHSPTPTSSHLAKKSSQILTDYVSPHSPTIAYSHPQSTTSTNTPDPVTPPMTPTHQRSLASSAPPIIKSAGTAGSSNPELSPVRLGHPSRPYYNAIRKNGISTPPPRTRPQSQPPPPPSSFHLGTAAVVSTASTTMASPSRHLSMSAMLASPTPFSAFSLVDDGDDDGDDDNGDFEVHSGPTNSARLSLSSSLHRQSYNSHTQSHVHNTQSLSRAKGIISNKSSGIGFSMSGETELRMALATSSPSGVATPLGRTREDGFRFRETVIPSENISNVDRTNARMDHINTRYVGSKDSFMGRVKKLRKGLKEMLMNKNTTTATTATT